MISASSFSRHSSHAATMDRVYRYQRHFYDLTRKYYLVGRDRLLRDLRIPDAGRVLVVGCGTGRNLIVAARRNPQALFYGLDISRQMLSTAEVAARRAGVAGRTFTVEGDAETFHAKSAFGVAGFDRILMSYSLSMIPNWQRALSQCALQLAPQGEIHIVDFGQMERWPRFARHAMRRWLRKFHVEPRSGLIVEAAELARKHGFDITATPIGGGYAWMIVIKQHSHRNGQKH